MRNCHANDITHYSHQFCEASVSLAETESKSPKPKKAKVEERECRVFEFEIFAIANPVVFVTG